MSLDKYKNTEFLILKKFCPDYVIPFSAVANNDLVFNNVLFMFYSQVHNDNYTNAIFYHSLSHENSINSSAILNKDFCGFLPSKVLIFEVSKEKAEKLISIIKETPLFKNNYSECC